MCRAKVIACCFYFGHVSQGNSKVLEPNTKHQVRPTAAMAQKTLQIISPNGDERMVPVLDTTTVREILELFHEGGAQDRKATLIRGMTLLEPDMTVTEAGLEDGEEISLVWSDPFVEMERWTGEERHATRLCRGKFPRLCRGKFPRLCRGSIPLGPSSPSGPLIASEQMIFLREPRHTLILKRSELSMSPRRLLVAFSKDDGLCWMMSIVRLKTKMMFLVG